MQDQRIENANVLIEGNLIKSISTDPIDAAGATLIDGGGRTLMPGLTDCHWHNMAAYMGGDVFAAGLGKLNLVAAHGAEKTLMRGFTSVRDPGGPVFELKEAIDDGMFVGPRIYAAGAMISGTDTAFALAKKHNLLFGFGTDTQFNCALAERQGPSWRSSPAITSPGKC